MMDTNFHALQLGRKMFFYSCPTSFQRGLAAAVDYQRQGSLDKNVNLSVWVLHRQADILAEAEPQGSA